jgi:hypothetical protein
MRRSSGAPKRTLLSQLPRPDAGGVTSMSRYRPQGLRACHPKLEVLEGRRLPAQFGVPWHDADHLTVSLVPDGTQIAGYPSNLFRTLDAQQPTADWQREILRAFQTWAVSAHINFAVKSDGGQPLGIPGPDQGDPRFGDIRIGAQPMSLEVLSISVPHDPFLSGTWSGDVLLNSAVPFGSTEDDLFPVLLHEVGHVLGLDHSPDPESVMSSHLKNRVGLAPSDIAAVQALYGPRRDDPFEGPGRNDSFQTATPMPAPAGYDGSTPLLIYANLSALKDVDFYSLRLPAGYQGPLTIRLQTAGVSLLAPHLTVYDAAGNVLGDVASENDVGDTLQVRMPRVEPGATYEIEVRGAAGDVFGIGEYVLATTFDVRTTVGPDAIDTLARQTYDYLSPADIRAIFLDPRGALFHDDHHTDDTFATAAPLSSIGVYGSEAPDRITASLGDPTDVDVYRIETPEEAQDDGADNAPDPPLVMTVTVRATEVNGIMPRASVFDQDRDPVPALVLAHGDGTFTIQVADARPDADYFIRVGSDPSSGKVVGNYDLDVEFGHEAAAPTEFVSSTLDGPNRQAAYDLVVNQTQLFDFLLTATSAAASPNTVLRMIITDSQGKIVTTRTAGAGGTAGGDPVLLIPGVYRVDFAIEAPGEGPPPPMTFRLYGASLSDPIGPAPDDPTLKPVANPTTGTLPATSPPVIGSPDDPYYWLALNLAAPSGQHAPSVGPLRPDDGRVALGPDGRDGPGARGGRDLDRTAGQAIVGNTNGFNTLIVLGVGVQGDLPPKRDAAPGAVVVAPEVGARALPARIVATSAVAPASIITAFTPLGSHPLDHPVGPTPELREGRRSDVGLEILGSPPGAAAVQSVETRSSQSPSPPGFGPRATGQHPARMPSGPHAAFPVRSEEAKVGPDSAQAVATLWITAIIYGYTHSRRVEDGERRPARANQASSLLEDRERAGVAVTAGALRRPRRRIVLALRGSAPSPSFQRPASFYSNLVGTLSRARAGQ